MFLWVYGHKDPTSLGSFSPPGPIYTLNNVPGPFLIDQIVFREERDEN